MAEVLKVSTPLVDRNLVTPSTRPGGEGGVPFNVVDPTRVTTTTDASELLQQNTGFVPNEEAPKILADLLKDPAVTVGMIRNIYMLQEVIKLLPANNTALTEEIQQLFDALLLTPDTIVPELQNQAESTTMFKGNLFDLLRNLVAQSETGTGTPGGTAAQDGGADPLAAFGAGRNTPNLLAGSAAAPGEQPGLEASVGNFLKALNASVGRQDALQSVANNLKFLADALSSSPRLADKLENLVRGLQTPDAQKHFPALKNEILSVMREVENSVLFTPQMQKTIPLVTYNLSRFNTNEDYLPDAMRQLLSRIDDPAIKEKLALELDAYVKNAMSFGGGHKAAAAESESKVMDILAKIISKQAQSEDLHLISGENVEKIVHSLLSSPSNFTPLLHFVIPVQYQDIQAFGEMWIDPNAEEREDASRGGMANTSHVLAVFDVEGVGRFETEMFVENKRIAMNLLCPPAYVDAFRDIGRDIRTAVSAIGYSFEAINIDRLERTHSLMEVFTDLPSRRVGIDVRI